MKNDSIAEINEDKRMEEDGMSHKALKNNGTESDTYDKLNSNWIERKKVHLLA